MRQKHLKVKRITRIVSKCKVPIKTYDKVQDSYADILEQNEDVIEIQCNVPFEDTSIDEFTCDYVITKQDGTFQTIPLCIFIYKSPNLHCVGDESLIY